MRDSLVDTLKAFEKYIEGGSIADLVNYMQSYDNLDRLNRHFHNPFISSEENRELTKSEQKLMDALGDILHKLNIDAKEFQFRNNIYDFLAEISRRGHQQTAFILNLVDEKDFFNKIKITLFGGATVTALVFGFIYLTVFEEILSIVLSLQASLLLIPFLGLIFTSIAALYQFIENQSDATLSSYNKKKNNIFLGINALIGLLGYLLILFSASTFFITTGLLILGALINVIKDIFDLVNIHKIYFSGVVDFKKLEADLKPFRLAKQDNLLIEKAFFRSAFNYEKKRNDIIINLVASLLLVSIVIVWCCLPAGIYTTVTIMALKGLVYLGRMIAQKLNEINERERLQAKLSELDLNKELLRNSQDGNLSETPSIKADEPEVPIPEPGNKDSQPRTPMKPKRTIQRTTMVSQGLGFRFSPKPKKELSRSETKDTDEQESETKAEKAEEVSTPDSVTLVDTTSFSAVYKKRSSIFGLPSQAKSSTADDLNLSSTLTPNPTSSS